jgi:hypothetical protein
MSADGANVPRPPIDAATRPVPGLQPLTSSLPTCNVITGQQESENCRQQQGTTAAAGNAAKVAGP